MAEIKAIETVYNGYKFRSRLEARWAVLFDELGVVYEYEKEGFNLGALGYYLPDFYFPETRWFAEIKGNPDDKVGIEKANYFHEHPPEYAEGCIIFGNIEFPKKVDEFPYVDDALIDFEIIAPRYSSERLIKAITRARQVRFEHGEKPQRNKAPLMHKSAEVTNPSHQSIEDGIRESWENLLRAVERDRESEKAKNSQKG